SKKSVINIDAMFDEIFMLKGFQEDEKGETYNSKGASELDSSDSNNPNQRSDSSSSRASESCYTEIP
ncbi:unnamed protein product, partial [Ilex paraguariensis]